MHNRDRDSFKRVEMKQKFTEIQFKHQIVLKKQHTEKVTTQKLTDISLCVAICMRATSPHFGPADENHVEYMLHSAAISSLVLGALTF